MPCTGCLCPALAACALHHHLDLLHHPRQRGAEALSAIGLLANFRGILVHDHWRASLSAAAEQAFCNAHPLRELIALAEADHPWPKRLIARLCEANDTASAALAQPHDRGCLPAV